MPLETARQGLAEIGNYEILAKLAEGGMGTVYKARRKTDNQIVAIKVVPSSAARNQVLIQRFKREFNAARQIDHPNVVKAIEFCEHGPNPYMVMEFVEGESLGQKLEREGKMLEAEAVRVMAQVCQGLHRAHKQNLIHRDVKPDNIMLTPDGVAKLTDLGLVKDVEGELNLTRTGRGLGTPHFMAPEQFRNAKHADIRCDIYSLGATLYMMVTGKMPFDGCGPLDAWMKKSNNEFPSPREIDPNVSDRVDWAIRRAMSANPEQRPETCREFIEDVTGQTMRASHVPHNPATDLWYMVYKDEEGLVHTVKGTTDNIRKAYRDGLLGDASNIRACRTKQGPFNPLQSYVEFRDLVIDAGSQVLKGESPAAAAASPAPPAPDAAARIPTRAVTGAQTPTPGNDPRDDAAIKYDATVTYPVQPRIVVADAAPTAEASPVSPAAPPPAPERDPIEAARLDATQIAHRPYAPPMQNNPVVLWLIILFLSICVGVLSVLLVLK